jgi:hypothetical protein
LSGSGSVLFDEEILKVPSVAQRPTAAVKNRRRPPLRGSGRHSVTAEQLLRNCGLL